MDSWKVTLEVDVIVEAQTKEEAIKQGIESASWQFFTEFSQSNFVKAEQINGYYDGDGTFIKE